MASTLCRPQCVNDDQSADACTIPRRHPVMIFECIFFSIWRVPLHKILKYVPGDFIGQFKFTSDQLMAWFRQTTKYYLTHCWFIPVKTPSVTRLYWDNICWCQLWLILCSHNIIISRFKSASCCATFCFKIRRMSQLRFNHRSAKVVYAWNSR